MLRFYETLTQLIFLLVVFISKFSKNRKFQSFVYLRRGSVFLNAVHKAEKSVSSLSGEKKSCFWLHVASAGELEQAIPIVRAITESQNVHFFLTYFSPDTEPFIKNVPGLIGHAGMPLDVEKNYAALISSLKIEKLFLVRYDFWPAMLIACEKHSVGLNLLAATMRRARPNILKRLFSFYRTWCLRKFSHIFAVTERDQLNLSKMVEPQKVHLAGDPKWSRARERSENLSKVGLSEKFGNFVSFIHFQKLKLQRTVYVFGSPHEEELSVALRLAQTSSYAWVIVAPHSLAASEIERFVTRAKNQNIEYLLYSQLEILLNTSAQSTTVQLDSSSSFADKPTLRNEAERLLQGITEDVTSVAQRCQFVIFDKMGALAELYALGDVAIVGGGFDGQIHNVLEPAAHPVATVFGNKLGRSQEAQTLVAKKAGISFDSPSDLFEFLIQCARLSGEPQHHLACTQKLAATRLSALELFGKTPNTNSVVLEALFRK